MPEGGMCDSRGFGLISGDAAPQNVLLGYPSPATIDFEPDIGETHCHGLGTGKRNTVENKQGKSHADVFEEMSKRFHPALRAKAGCARTLETSVR